MALALLLLLTPAFGLDEFPYYQASNFTDRVSGVSDQNATVFCVRYENKELEVREAFGKWFVQEIYTHIMNEGQTQYQACPATTIWETDDFPRTTFGVRYYVFF